MVTLGLWIDDAPARVLGPGYADELVELGVRTAAIMVSAPGLGWRPTWTIGQVQRATLALVERDIEVVLTTWPSPRRAVIDECCAWLEAAVVWGATGLEVDLEGQWKAEARAGFAGLGEAAAYLLSRLRSITSGREVRLELTTHPWHAESSPRALVAPHVDRLLEQAYSIHRRPGGEVVAWDSRTLGPGHHQRWAADDARTVPGVAQGRPRLAMGLAAWSQVWPGHDPDEALGLAYQAALEADPAEVRLWSSKWVLGAQANGYSNAWLRSLAKASRMLQEPRPA